MRHASPVRTIGGPDVRTGLRRVVVFVGFVAYTLWEEALLSGPVVAATGVIGPWPAFVTFTTLYGTGGFILTLLVVRAYARRLGGRPSRLQRWVEREAASKHQRWARRLLERGRWLGFAIASFALGPIVTTWLLFAAGRYRDKVVTVAVASSVIFGVTFVAPYVGIGRLLFGG